MTILAPTTEENNARKGYPPHLKEIKCGQMTMPDILEGADMLDAVKIEKTAHNEITFTKKDGTKICRLRETNIVTLLTEGEGFLLNTGGWPTRTTFRHMADFVERNTGLKIQVGGIKKGDNKLYIFQNSEVHEAEFKQWIVVTIVNSKIEFMSDKTQVEDKI